MKNLVQFSTPQQAYFDVWHYSVKIVFSTDINDSIKTQFPEETKFNGTSTDACHMFRSDEPEPESFLFFPFTANASTIGHECWHAVRRMLLFAGTDLENETVAYHLGWLIGEVTKFQKIAKSKRKVFNGKRNNKHK